MFESKDIQKLNTEREEMKKYIIKKITIASLDRYKGSVILADLFTDITIEIKRINERLDELVSLKESN